MRKFTHLDALDHTRRRKSKAPLVILLLMVLIAALPVFEIAKLNVARFGLFGLTHADTPILDLLAVQWSDRGSELRDWVTPLMVNRRWNPRLVVPFACLWTLVAALMLRRGH